MNGKINVNNLISCYFSEGGKKILKNDSKLEFAKI